MTPIQQVYGLVNERLAEQISSIDRIDAKLGLLVGFNGVILSIVLGNGGSICWQFILGLVFLFVAFAILSLAIKGRKFKSVDPKLICEYYEEHLANQEYEEGQTDPLFAQFTSDAWEAYEQNTDELAKKSTLGNWGLFMMICGLASLAFWVLGLP